MSPFERVFKRSWRAIVGVTGLGIAIVGPGCSSGGGGDDVGASAAALQTAGTIGPSQPVGTLPGAMAVGDDGSASYTIPLWVPPGRLGMEPSLGITYSSRAGNGLLGIGWSLSGTSTIEPCAQTAVEDGRNRAVRLDGHDPYCLDGARLVPLARTVTTTECPGGGDEYRTLPDGFSRVVACGTDAAGPLEWLVYAKDGRVLRYGDTTDSRLDATAHLPGAVPVRVGWLLAASADRNGNFIAYSYLRSGGMPGPTCTVNCLEFRPNRIDYTGAPGLAPTRSIQFDYDPVARPDKRALRLRTVPTHKNDRLLRVRALAGGALVRSYELGYDQSPTSGRSRLKSIRTCDGAGVCLPASALTYTSDALHVPFAGSVTGAMDPLFKPGYPLHFTDVDGDGKDDMLYWTPGGQGPAAQWWLRKSTGTTFLPAVSLDAGSNTVLQDPNWVSPPGSAVYDVNGDGNVDLVTQGCQCQGQPCQRVACSTPRAYASDGTKFTVLPTPPLPTTWSPPVTILDVAGQGDVRYIQQNAGNKYEAYTLSGLFLSPYRPSDATAYTSLFGTTAPDAATAFFRDLDRDGAYEFLFLQPGQTNYSALDEIQELAGQPTAEVTTNINLGYGPCLAWGDFNGDGLLDALDLQTRRLYAYDGYKFNVSVPSQWWSSSITPLPSCTAAGDPGFRVVDYNGDGLDDVLVLGKAQANTIAERAQVLLTNPDGWGATAAAVDVYIEALLGTADGAAASRTIDADGDGEFDLFQINAQGQFVLHRQVSEPPDLLVTVLNGLGSQDSVQYAPLAAGSAVYTKAPGAFMGPTYVVSAQDVNDGAGSTFRLQHTYQNAIVDRREGFLGFAVHQVTDSRDGSVVRTTYDNSTRKTAAGKPRHAYTATPSEVLSYVKDGAIWHAARTKSALVALDTNGGHSCFTFARSTETKTYEGPAFQPTNPGATFDCPTCTGILSTTTSNIDGIDGIDVSTGTISGTATFGNVTKASSNRGGGFTATTTTSFAQDDAAAWLVGRPTLRRVTSVAPAAPSGETRTVSMAYDARGELVTTEREAAALGSTSHTYQRTTLTRNSLGAVTQILVAPDRSDTSARTVAFDSADGQWIHATSFKNALGHTSTRTMHSGLGVALSSVDPNGLETDFDYDGFGRVTQVRNPDGSSVTTGYFALSFPFVFQINTTASDGARSATYFDQLGRATHTARTAFDLTTTFVDTTYDSHGRVTSVTKPYRPGTTAVPYAVRYDYDVLGRVTGRHRRDTVGGGITKPFVHTTFTGLTTTTCDEIGVCSSSEMDAAGHVAKTSTYPQGVAATTQFTVGAFDAVVTVTDPAGHVVTTGHDAIGRVTDVTDADIGHRHTDYDELDQTAATTDARGIKTTYTYDALGRPKSRVAPDGSDTWSYDPPGGKGLLAGQARGAASATFAYDTKSRLANEQWTIDGQSYAYDYGYDALGRLATTAYPIAPGRARFVVRRDYNVNGYLFQLEDASNAAAPKVLWTAQAADAEGHVTREALGNGLVTTRTFDPATSRLATVTTPGIYDMAYAYYDNADLASRTDNRNTAWNYPLTRTESFGYDGVNRLASATIAGRTPATFTYTYDALGNLTDATDMYSGTQGCRSLVYGTAGYGPHQLARATCYGNPTTHTYDANGNETLTVAPDFREQTWTSFDKQAEVHTRNGRMAYTYDANHARIKKEVVAGALSWANTPELPRPNDGNSGVWSTTIYAGAAYEKRTSSAPTIDHVYTVSAGGSPVGQMIWRQSKSSSSGTEDWRYFHDDHQGTVERTTDASGALKDIQSFDGWGARRQPDWSYVGGWTMPADLRTGFTGQEMDDEFSGSGTGLVDMRGRSYDTYFKRFTSADRIVQSPAHGPSWNRYSYVWNNPLNATDPTGYVGESELGDTLESIPVLPPIIVHVDLGDVINALSHLCFWCSDAPRPHQARTTSTTPGDGNDGRLRMTASELNALQRLSAQNTYSPTPPSYRNLSDREVLNPQEQLAWARNVTRIQTENDPGQGLFGGYAAFISAERGDDVRTQINRINLGKALDGVFNSLDGVGGWTAAGRTGDFSTVDPSGTDVAIVTNVESSTADVRPSAVGDVLSAHGVQNGHLLTRHVGWTESALAARLAAQSSIRAASTFSTRAEAATAIGSVMTQRAVEINSWVASGAKGTRAFDGTFGGGTVFVRGAPQAVTGTGARVVLKGDGGGNFFILTGYPLP